MDEIQQTVGPLRELQLRRELAEQRTLHEAGNAQVEAVTVEAQAGHAEGADLPASARCAPLPLLRTWVTRWTARATRSHSKCNSKAWPTSNLQQATGVMSLAQHQGMQGRICSYRAASCSGSAICAVR